MALSNSDLSEIKALIGREATPVELHIFDTMWSEHCSYKSSKEVLKAHLPTQGSEVALGIGEDAGIVRFAKVGDRQYCLAISHESHNHPSQILPIEGAATGVGGVVRDVYCMGADVIGVLNSLHFGLDRTGKNPLVDEIAQEVVRGVSDYANPLGVPVLGGETLYHPSYNQNCLVNVAAVGIVEESKIIRSKVPEHAKQEPYVMVLIGKSTDATGFGGASFSSATLDTENDHVNLGAVQVHDPFLKRVLVQAIHAILRRVDQENIIIGFKDLGAGGISCATSELAAAGGFGVTVHLDRVNVVDPVLPPEVIACSETQERFCLAVPKAFADTILDIVNNQYALPSIYPNAGAAIIGDVTQERRYVLMHQNKTVCDLPIEIITTEVRAKRESAPAKVEVGYDLVPALSNEVLQHICHLMMGDENSRSKRYVYRFFDQAVRGDTVIYPGEADAVVVTPIEGSKAAMAVSMDSNLYGDLDPYMGGVAAVAESVRNVISVGARPIAITDCLNYGNPEKPPVFWQFEQGVKGIGDAARALGFIKDEALPVISGNVSFYNESSQGSAVIPSPVIVTLASMDDYQKAITLQLKQADSVLILVGNPQPHLGGSLVGSLIPELNGKIVPQVDLATESARNQAIHHLIQSDQILACHDISSGGIWGALCEMVMGERGLSRCGAILDIPGHFAKEVFLFSESSGFIVEVSPAYLKNVEQTLKDRGVEFVQIGHTQASPQIRVKQHNQELFFLNSQAIVAVWNEQVLGIVE